MNESCSPNKENELIALGKIFDATISCPYVGFHIGTPFLFQRMVIKKKRIIVEKTDKIDVEQARVMKSCDG